MHGIDESQYISGKILPHVAHVAILKLVEIYPSGFLMFIRQQVDKGGFGSKGDYKTKTKDLRPIKQRPFNYKTKTPTIKQRPFNYKTKTPTIKRRPFNYKTKTPL